MQIKNGIDPLSRSVGWKPFCIVIGAAALCLGSAISRGANITTLVSFNNPNGGAPSTGLIADSAGNLYGTTSEANMAGTGTIFKIAVGTHAFSTLSMFNDYATGSDPSGLMIDSGGNLYGATTFGTASLFMLPAGSSTITTLGTFYTGNGTSARGAPIADNAGNIFGTAHDGGTDNNGILLSNGPGTIYMHAAGGNSITAVSFNGANGSGPSGGLIADRAGNFYGTTSAGGAYQQGTVFKFASGSKTITALASFNGSDGADPRGTLIADGAGNFYGTSYSGGTYGDGTIFKLTAGTNVLTALASFDGDNGANPCAGLIADAAGNLYGTTASGGAGNYGTVFKLPAGSNAITTLASFNYINGADPRGGLIADSSGNLYGTTASGGADTIGTVFEITNSGFATPEPSSLCLAALGAIGLLRRRRAARQ